MSMFGNPLEEDDDLLDEISTEEEEPEEEPEEESGEEVEEDAEGESSEDDAGEDTEEDESEEEESEDDDSEEEESEEENPEYDEEEIELPDFLTEDFIPPEFRTQKEELSWLRENYGKLVRHFSTEEFIEDFAKTYEKVLIDKEQKVEHIRAVAGIFENDPALAFKIFQPQFVAMQGYDPVLSDEELGKITDEQMSHEFGADWVQVYNPELANDPKTISGKIWARYSQIQEWGEQQRTEAQSAVKENHPMTKAEMEEYLKNEYNTNFSYMKQDEFSTFVNKARERTAKLNLKDVEVLLNFEDIKKQEYERGVAEGKKTLVKEIKKAGGETYKPKATQIKKSTRKDSEKYSGEYGRGFGPFGRF